LTSHKVALFDNTITVSSATFSTATAYAVAPFNAGEVSGTGYTVGGNTLAGTSVTESPTGTLMWDGTDSSWPTSTIPNAHGCLIYADALAGNNGIVFVNFGADYSTSAGTFTIQWASGGIFTIDLTP
jgi:hypothetical protein